MIQGAGSNVGKSLAVAGLCRVLSNRGFRVSPFKPQNMSNNAAAVADGAEIGRAQHLQANACRVAPSVDMNPVLLKPETEIGAQVVVLGKRLTTVRAKDYAALRPTLLPKVIQSFARLCRANDFVLVEGAGSPAETNLRKSDIANMGFASEVRIPVILLGDIERGGVIAQLVGTHAVLEQGDSELIRGFAINKFRGDISLFTDGARRISKMTGWPCFGTIPWFERAGHLPAEDAQDLERTTKSSGEFKIACLALSRIANFDDLDPLRLETDVAVEIVHPGQVVPADSDLVIIPGTKSTRGDLAFLRQQGWDVDVMAHVRRGGRVLGICGGYQILGKMVDDSKGIEGPSGISEGLGLLDATTIMEPRKRVREVSVAVSGQSPVFSAYEIHMGRTAGKDTDRPFAFVHSNGGLRPEGAVSSSGRVTGTYLHGLFTNDAFRRDWLRQLGARSSGISYSEAVDETLNALADHLEGHLDIERLIDTMSEPSFA